MGTHNKEDASLGHATDTQVFSETTTEDVRLEQLGYQQGMKRKHITSGGMVY
jgi:hypothetical protein